MHAKQKPNEQKKKKHEIRGIVTGCYLYASRLFCCVFAVTDATVKLDRMRIQEKNSVNLISFNMPDTAHD